MVRVQVILDPHERERFRELAEREGKSLSAWMKDAALARVREAEGRRRLRSPVELRRFFDDCDRREEGREPDWSEHLAVIAESRIDGLKDR